MTHVTCINCIYDSQDGNTCDYSGYDAIAYEIFLKGDNEVSDCEYPWV